MTKTVYLAGPINDTSDAEAMDWRKYVADALPRSIAVLDPMARDYRGVEDTHFEEIVDADVADIADSDVVLAFCPKPSVGTSMEVFMAFTGYHRRRPQSHSGYGRVAGPEYRAVVVVVVPEGAPVSPWLAYHCDRLFRSLTEAVEYIAT